MMSLEECGVRYQITGSSDPFGWTEEELRAAEIARITKLPHDEHYRAVDVLIHLESLK
jgi:hypothetical protein